MVGSIFCISFWFLGGIGLVVGCWLGLVVLLLDSWFVFSNVSLSIVNYCPNSYGSN